jgi:hypothetical protein
MAIPSVVARQAEISEQIRKDAYEKKPTEEEAVETVIETPPIEEPIEKPPEDDWKGKHDRLYGQYSEVIAINKGLAEDSANLRTEISSLRAEINALKTTKEPPPPEPGPDEEELSLTEQFPEVSKLTDKKVKREIEKRDRTIAELRRDVEVLKTGVTTVSKRVERTEGQGFEREMDTLVDKRGNWRQMNTPGSEFLKWCGTEKIHGHFRYDLMIASYQREDFPAVAEHFNDFIAMKNPKKKGEEIIEGEENLGLPKPGTGGKPPKDDKALEDKKPITRTFVKNTLKDIALRKYKNNPKEAERLKKLIDDKQAKGLIIDG